MNRLAFENGFVSRMGEGGEKETTSYSRDKLNYSLRELVSGQAHSRVITK